MAVSQNRVTIPSSSSISWYVLKGTESKDSNRYLYTHIQSRIIHSDQKVEVTKYLLMDEWISKM